MEWKEYEDKYKPIYTEKMQLISHLLKPILLPKKLQLENQLEIVEYIHQFGLDAVSKVFFFCFMLLREFSRNFP